MIHVKAGGRPRRHDAVTMPDANEASPPPAADTRERILAAAARRFAAQGRDGASMRDIAADTGLTMPTLYHHFGDKRGLYDACVASVVEPAARTLREAVHRADTDAARAQAFAATLCALLLDDRGLLALLQREASDGSPALSALVPAELLDAVDAALVPAPAGYAHALGPARRLLAYALGCAIVLRSNGGEVPGAPDADGLAGLLLGACRVSDRRQR